MAALFRSIKKIELYNLYLEDGYFSRDDLNRKLEIFDRLIKGLKQHLKSMSVDTEKIRADAAKSSITGSIYKL